MYTTNTTFDWTFPVYLSFYSWQVCTTPHTWTSSRALKNLTLWNNVRKHKILYLFHICLSPFCVLCVAQLDFPSQVAQQHTFPQFSFLSFMKLTGFVFVFSNFFPFHPWWPCSFFLFAFLLQFLSFRSWNWSCLFVFSRRAQFVCVPVQLHLHESVLSAGVCVCVCVQVCVCVVCKCICVHEFIEQRSDGWVVKTFHVWMCARCFVE